MYIYQCGAKVYIGTRVLHGIVFRTAISMVQRYIIYIYSCGAHVHIPVGVTSITDIVFRIWRGMVKQFT